MDTYCNPFNVGIGIVVSGTVTCTVQHTFDETNAPGGIVTWFPHPTIAGKSDNQDGNYAFPVSGIKVLVTAGTGTATLTMIQAGIT
jgi:hypothetical protein